MIYKIIFWMTSGCLIAACTVVYAQKSLTLAIVSPTNGTSVLPGDVITVVVDAEGLIKQGSEVVTASGPGIGFGTTTDPQTIGLHRTFTLTFSTSAPSGSYPIMAIASENNGKTIKSAPVHLVIQPLPYITKISVMNSNLVFNYIGQQFRLDSREFTAQGWTQLEADELDYRSLNSAVATVNAKGEVTALSDGTTQIVASYGDTSTAISVVVTRSGVPGDFTGDGKVDSNDVNGIYRWRDTSASGPNDARDLNHDGVIDAKDLEIEKSLCTYANCATHQ